MAHSNQSDCSTQGERAICSAEAWPGDWLGSQQLTGFIAVNGGTPAGLVTYRVHEGASPAGSLELEVVTIDAVVARRGIGSALLQAAFAQAAHEHCRRVWLVTTNDNVVAQGFYARNGMRLAAVHADALDRSRELKPSIPSHADNGVPIRDEWEYELLLDPDVGAPRAGKCLRSPARRLSLLVGNQR